MDGLIEILAPAGSAESIEPAVRCGANAIYLGASRFSARGSAQNFDYAQLREAVEYCHIRGVKVYLAINTMLRDEELGDALALAEYACSLPVDAIIVQDLGFASLLKQRAPQMKLNASTQMSLHTPAGVRLAQELGFGRVVLSRELSKDEVREICEGTSLELEAFVHGALCMSVSGQCYFSALLGGRSGNRGLCAQTCRLPFKVCGGNTDSALSLKDLSLAKRIGELEEVGVCSAKIEGRMKRPEYVAVAVSACAHARDGDDAPFGLYEDLRRVFSRSGFTTGYWDNELGSDMFGKRSRDDVVSADNAVFARIHTLSRNERASIPLSMNFTMKSGKPSSLTLSDNDGNSFTVSGEVPSVANNRPLTADDCQARLSKLGGTPFYAENFSCDIDDGLILPASEMNRMRREAVEEIMSKRAKKPAIPFSDSSVAPVETHRPQSAQPSLRLHFAYADQIPDNCDCADLIYLPISTPIEKLEELQDRGLPIGIELPRGMFGVEESLRKKLREVRDIGILDVWAGTLNAVALAKEENMLVHGGFGLNVANSQSLEALRELGVEDTELSCELTLLQSSKLGGELPRGVMIYGRQPMMLTRNCPVKSGGKSCVQCARRGELIDRKDAHFPVRCIGNCTEILNSVPTVLLDRTNEIHNVDFCFMRFTVENPVEIKELLNQSNWKIRPSFPFTRGLSEKGVL